MQPAILQKQKLQQVGGFFVGSLRTPAADSTRDKDLIPTVEDQESEEETSQRIHEMVAKIAKYVKDWEIYGFFFFCWGRGGVGLGVLGG